MSEKYFWPCFYVNQPCGASTWVCSRFPMSEEKTKKWLTLHDQKHREDTSAFKGNFASTIVPYGGFWEYFFANKAIPKPRVWTSK